ncbi:MAG: Gfo/Idh/MocA family oxidoreductase [Spirochaetes bacterium]|nr:Gfo/Idh/MocA family oxidoreductase [Spirochaetota bacterium]
MSESTTIRIATVGVGGMGGAHLKHITANKKAKLVAVCDVDKARADDVAAKHGATAYYDHREMFKKEKLDAVTIATPHYDHPGIAMDAFTHGLHVLSEKPIGVYVKAARKAVEAHEAAKAKYPGLVYAIMFQERTYLHYRKMKAMIQAGELGRLMRTTWIATDWFRTQWYYDHGDWRATWKGEGGGVLLNQCPHTLDMFQWLVGVPSKVTGHVSLGKYHDIEVEDEATAFFEYDNGMIGHFTAITAESPGINRLEIVGENGRLVLDGKALTFHRNSVSGLKHLREAASSFERAPFVTETVDYDDGQPTGHHVVVDKFLDAILDGTPLIAEAKEGLNSLAMSNAIMLSSFTGTKVSVPPDEDAFKAELDKRIATSKFRKHAATAAAIDFDASWKK